MALNLINNFIAIKLSSRKDEKNQKEKRKTYRPKEYSDKIENIIQTFYFTNTFYFQIIFHFSIQYATTYKEYFLI